MYGLNDENGGKNRRFSRKKSVSNKRKNGEK